MNDRTLDGRYNPGKLYWRAVAEHHEQLHKIHRQAVDRAAILPLDPSRANLVWDTESADKKVSLQARWSATTAPMWLVRMGTITLFELVKPEDSPYVWAADAAPGYLATSYHYKRAALGEASLRVNYSLEQASTAPSTYRADSMQERKIWSDAVDIEEYAILLAQLTQAASSQCSVPGLS